MKIPIKTIALGAFMVAGMVQASVMHAHPLEKLMPFVTNVLWNSKSFLDYSAQIYRQQLDLESTPYEAHKILSVVTHVAKQQYGLECKYPTHISYSIPNASALTEIAKNHKGELKAIDKYIMFHEHFLRNYDIKELIFVLFHEHEHLDKDHELNRIKLKRLLSSNNSVVLNNTTISPKEFHQDPTILSRIQEEEADAAIRQHPPLCYAAHTHFMREHKYNLSILKGRYGETSPYYQEMINLLESNDPEMIKKNENDRTHPHDIRRALYFLKWAEEAKAAGK